MKSIPLLARLGLGQMSHGEYQANLSGLNVFFGAVLGLALTGAEKLNTWQFGLILSGMSVAVISIHYISSSKNRISYAIFSLVLAVIFPELIDFALHGDGLVPEKIRPTLLVWTVLTIIVEFWAREKEQPAQA